MLRTDSDFKRMLRMWVLGAATIKIAKMFGVDRHTVTRRMVGFRPLDLDALLGRLRARDVAAELACRKLVEGGVVHVETGCWVWFWACSSRVYGSINFDGRRTTASRLAFKLFVGDLRERMMVCHRCDTPPCFNPDHLFLGTHHDNVSDYLTKTEAGIDTQAWRLRFPWV